MYQRVKVTPPHAPVDSHGSCRSLRIRCSKLHLLINEGQIKPVLIWLSRHRESPKAGNRPGGNPSTSAKMAALYGDL